LGLFGDAALALGSGRKVAADCPVFSFKAEQIGNSLAQYAKVLMPQADASNPAGQRILRSWAAIYFHIQVANRFIEKESASGCEKCRLAAPG
jgi:hypothetical protein